MADTIADLVNRIRNMKDELEQELQRRRREFCNQIEQGQVDYKREVPKRHQTLKRKLLSYVADARPFVVLTAPFIYSVIVPFALLDLFMTLYQAICFFWFIGSKKWGAPTTLQARSFMR